AEISKTAEIIKLPIREPYALAKRFSAKKTKQLSSGILPNKKTALLEKLMLWVRGNFFIPDARVGWVAPSVSFLTHYIEKTPVTAVITTGPPHSLHLIGLKLKKVLNIKWVADFRDPWTTVHYHKSLRLLKTRQKKHQRLEAEVLNKADVLTVTSQNTKTEFERSTPKPIHVITNGFDNIPKFNGQRDTKFSLAHIGSLLGKRDPVPLWEVLAEILKEDPTFKKRFKSVLKPIGKTFTDKTGGRG
ncbi:MAG: glycosyltransferase, partial [Marinirhabdus sp.]